MFPVRQSVEPKYSYDEFQKVFLTDFTGGINITDPQVSLPENQFSDLYNFFYNRQKTLHSRPPYRPLTFSSAIQDKPVSVVIGSDTYTPSTIHDYYIFREDITDWSYGGEMHVVAFFSTASRLIVAVYNTDDEEWKAIWNSETATAVSVCQFKINEAFDLIIFPDDANPERWISSTATLSDLGLAAPEADGFTTVFTEGANTYGDKAIDLMGNPTIYYKFAYFYDDSNVSTKYGESSTTSITSQNNIDSTGNADDRQITIVFTDASIPSGVSKIKIYRAPSDTVDGPFRYIGETDVSDADSAGGATIDDFIDHTPWDFEGAEDLDNKSNPSFSGSELALVNVRTIRAHLVGFVAAMPYKMVWCNSGYPDVWNPLNFDYLESEGKAAIEFNRKIYAFTNNACYQKEAVGETAFKISNIGCASGRSLQDVGNGLIWMDYDTVYFADFVQAYGSKGDFPLDIGHPISSSISRRDEDSIVSSTFFERRYYITYVDTEDFLRRTYMFDVDVSAWTQHSMRHYAVARGDNTLYSLGAGNSKYYVYEHNYVATVAIAVGGSTYEGRDYHDYGSVTAAAWADMTTITLYIKKGSILFSGETRKTFISSLTLLTEGTYVSAIMTVSGGEETFSTSKTFTDDMGTSAVDTYPARWGIASWSADGDTAETGRYMGFKTGSSSLHKKIKRVIKSDRIAISLTNTDTRELKIIGIAVYYKPLPMVA